MSQKDMRQNTLLYDEALVWCLRGFDVLEPKGKWFERLLISVLRKSYQQRLRHLIEILPGDMGDEILKGE